MIARAKRWWLYMDVAMLGENVACRGLWRGKDEIDEADVKVP